MPSFVSPAPRICLVWPHKGLISETFIKAHCERLHGRIFVVHGGVLPKLTDRNESLQEIWRGGKWRRLLFRMRRCSQTYIDREAFKHYLLQQRIQVVLAEYGVTGAEIYAICQALHVPLLVHFHGFDAFHRPTLEKYQQQYAAMFRYATAIIGVSHAMLDQLVALGAPRDKLVYNPYGPHDDFFSLSPNFDAMNFVAVGRFVEKKAPYLTLAAFQELHRQFPAARLMMAGDGDLLPICKDLAHYWGLQEAVTFFGAVDHERVKELYGNAFCFLQHSVTAQNGDAEGTPVAILEASAAGLPVIATRHAGIQDVVIHEETGWLVEERDVRSMAAYMGQLVVNREDAKAAGERGRKRVQQYFSQERHIRLLNEEVEQAIRKWE